MGYRRRLDNYVNISAIAHNNNSALGIIPPIKVAALSIAHILASALLSSN